MTSDSIAERKIDMLRYEREYWGSGVLNIAGVDEAVVRLQARSWPLR